MGSFMGWLEGDPVAGILYGILFGLAVMFALGLGPALGLLAVAPLLRVRGRSPLVMMRFLEAARRKQVLRQAGAVYQFRHADLQNHLARQYSARQHHNLTP
jgi:predicted lipid-binding transport protein (Tim44 family)